MIEAKEATFPRLDPMSLLLAVHWNEPFFRCPPPSFPVVWLSEVTEFALGHAEHLTNPALQRMFEAPCRVLHCVSLFREFGGSEVDERSKGPEGDRLALRPAEAIAVL